MKAMRELAPETIVTVSRITGNKDQKLQLEKLGIMAGTDLTVLRVTEEGVLADTGRQQILLTDDMIEIIRFGSQFKRTKEPMLLECFCGGGNNEAFLDHFEKVWQEREQQCKLHSDS